MIGSTIRSANRNASTPAKPIPPDHSTAASGTLPIEQTNDATAINGPTSALSIAGHGAGAWTMKRLSKKLLPSCAMKPASRKPAAISL